MINYIEKGVGLHHAISSAGHTLHQHDGVWVSGDDAAVQAIIDAYTLTSTQNEIAARIDAHASAMRDRGVTGISPAEMASWSIKRAEAAAFTASGNPLDAPVLSMEASARGVPLSAIVSRVLANATSLAGLEATIAGVAGRHKDAVKATTTFSDALAYDWSGGWPNV